MKDRPLIFTVLALGHFLVAAGIPLQICLLYGHSPLELAAIFHKITLSNMAVIVTCLLNSYLSLQAHHWLKYTLPLSLIIVAFNNLLVSSFATDYTHLETTLATLLFITGHGTLFFVRAKEVFDHPALRWWLVPKRFELNLPVWVQLQDGNYLSLQTFDLSKNGAFIVADQDKMNLLSEGTPLHLALKGEDLTYHLEATLIRKAKPQGRYPMGLGIRFEKVGLAARLYLFKLLLWSRLSDWVAPKA
jgi:hypothetical protein